jgi:small subunit ribosomal protein S5
MSDNQEVKTTTTESTNIQNNTAPVTPEHPKKDSNFGDRSNSFRDRDKRDRKPKRGRGARNDRRKNNRTEEAEKFESKVIQVRRVTKVVKGGKKMKFSAMVVVGDRNGKIGFALRKGNDFQDAVAKASRIAQQNMIDVSITDQGSLSFPTNHKFKSSKIFIKPAQTGTGLIAGGFIRPILELAGVKNIYSKIIGSRN